MKKSELVCSVLKEMGYNPTVDDDGDVMFRYQMKALYVMIGNEDETYLSLLLPQFYTIEEGEDTLVLATCNKLTRDIKLVKFYVDCNCESVSATCEFYYNDEESLRCSLEHSLDVLSVARTIFRKAKRELEE